MVDMVVKIPHEGEVKICQSGNCQGSENYQGSGIAWCYIVLRYYRNGVGREKISKKNPVHWHNPIMRTSGENLNLRVLVRIIQ